MSHTTPLADVLIASLREEYIHTCNALALILSEIDRPVLEEQIRAACTLAQNEDEQGEVAGKHFGNALQKQWPGVSENLTRAAWHAIEAEPGPVLEIFDSIVFEMFEDPEANVAHVLR